MHLLGNTDLLSLHKVAFLCSRLCPESVALRSCDWADRQRENGICVISGFQSPVEKDVLRRLVRGRQPFIVALAKGINRIEPELEAPLDQGRLLIVTAYAQSVTHACQEKCFHRNRLMMELAQEVVVGFVAAGGGLERLCREFGEGKRITFL